MSQPTAADGSEAQTDAGSSVAAADAAPDAMLENEPEAGVRASTAKKSTTAKRSANTENMPAKDASSSERPAADAPAAASNAGTAAADEVWPADCKERFVFRAHGYPDSADPSKYELESGAERVVTFYFDAPWTIEAVQLLKNKERIENMNIVHHWMLYLIDNSEHKDGDILDDHNRMSLTTLLDQQSVMGGIPGSGDITMPEGVGMHLPPGKMTYALSIHYLNATDTTQYDSSGIEICVTDEKRPADASTHWVGKLSFNLQPHTQTDIVATCQPNAIVDQAHIIATTPHMHSLGRHTKLEIARAGGDNMVLLDAPYDFDSQRIYDITKDHAPEDLMVRPGDQIKATCAFDNTTDAVVQYGEGSTDEMCLISVLAWPAGSLINGYPFSAALGLSEDQVCLEP